MKFFYYQVLIVLLCLVLFSCQMSKKLEHKKIGYERIDDSLFTAKGLIPANSFVVNPWNSKVAYLKFACDSLKLKKEINNQNRLFILPSQIFINDVGEKVYDQVIPGSIKFSPHGKHLAYWAVKNNKLILAIDQSESQQFRYDMNFAYNWRLEYPIVQKPYVAIYQDCNSTITYYDAITYGIDYPDLFNRNNCLKIHYQGLEFSDNENQISYVAPDSKENLYSLYLNHKKIDNGEWFGSSSVIFSPDGKQVAYHVQIKGKWKIKVGGYSSPDYSDVGVIEFSQDSKSWACMVWKGDFAFMLINGREYGSGYKEIKEFSFGATSSTFGFIGEKVTGKDDLWINNNLVSSYNDIWNLKFSEKSNSYAFCAKDKSKEFVVNNNKIIIPAVKDNERYKLSRDNDISISPVTGTIAYSISMGDSVCLVVNNQIYRKFSRISPAVFSKDGKHMMYAGAYDRTNKKTGNMTLDAYLYTDSVYVGPYDAITDYFFSPDSKHSIYRVWKNDKTVLYLDKKEVDSHNSWIAGGGPQFIDNQTMRYIYPERIDWFDKAERIVSKIYFRYSDFKFN
jgi:hypothetical protein